MGIYFKARNFLLLMITLAACICPVYAQTAPVQVTEKTIYLPTYLLGHEDPNPPFQIINSRRVYPYTMLDDLTTDREVRPYKAIVLENQYLRATVLPELGGKLYSLYDKVNKQDVFYRNESIKYALIALRGAWISGGIEFNFPSGHTTDTVSPVSSWYHSNSDGSASLFVGDVDQVSEMYWQVELTLRPGTSRLEQRVVLFNPDTTDHLYWYWNNAAVPATDDLHFIYPMREVNPDSRSVFWSYPIWEGTDYSHYRNIRQPTELFGEQVHRNYFGVYYDRSDYGVVHFADHRDVTGKKIFTWGVAGNGTIWTGLLTDKDGPYCEIQAGRFETQLNQEYMPPQDVESWTEYWYPVQHLGDGFVEATKQFAINISFLTASTRTGNVLVSVSPTEHVDGAMLVVLSDGKKALTISGLSFGPMVTRTFSIPVEDITAARKTTVVDIVSATGQSLLHWSAASPIDGNRDFVSKVGVQPAQEGPYKENTGQGLFLQAKMEEKEGDIEDAQRLYEKSLEQDHNYIPVLKTLAMQQYLAANFNLSGKYIERAVRQDPSDTESLYMEGIIDRAAGKTSLAQDAFWKAVRLGGQLPQSLMQLGEISLSTKKYTRAVELLRRAQSYDPLDALVQSDLAVALRLSQDFPEAAKVATGAALAMPLYPVALAEQYRNAAPSKVRHAKTMWEQTVGDRTQNYLEAGSWYWGIKDWQSSEFILKKALGEFPEQETSPMLYYYLASNARHEGMKKLAEYYVAKARTARYDEVFPNRVTDAEVLQEALRYYPKDAHAQYLLGDFLFQHGRYQEADKLWSAAEASGLQLPVLYRNLGVYAWKVKEDLEKASCFYQKAIQLAPQEYRYYADLDKIYAQEGATQARMDLFSKAPSAIFDHDEARIRYILLLIQEGKFEEALGLLMDHHFNPWEKGANVHDVFVFANIEAGHMSLMKGKYGLAQKYFHQAMEYPNNLGTGRPDKPNNSAAIYWMGRALNEQGYTAVAYQNWKQVIADENKNPLSEYYAALSMEAIGDKKRANNTMVLLTDGLDKTKSSADDYYVAGLVEIHRSHRQQARAYFKMALEKDPSLWQAQYELNNQSNLTD
jgi:tetratricopeptide (TPR) repeat protein